MITVIFIVASESTVIFKSVSLFDRQKSLEEVHLGIYWPNRKSIKIRVAGHTLTHIQRLSE